MTQLTTTTRTDKPLPMSRVMDDLVRRFTSRLEDTPGDFRRSSIAASQAPSVHERDAMTARRNELSRSLIAEPETARPVILALLGAFPTYGMDAQPMRDMIALYCRALDGSPTWAVKIAVERFLKGGAKTAWDGTRCPTPPQFVAEARQATVDVETEIHRIEQVINAHIVTSEVSEGDKAAVLARWNEIRTGICAAADPGRKPAQAERSEEARHRASVLEADRATRASRRAKEGEAV